MECATSDIITNSQTDIILHGYRPRKFFFVRHTVASSTTVCCTQPTKTSITRCFSLSTSFTGSGIHATVLNPKCFSCVVWCMIALFWLKNNVVNIADIRCCTSFSLRSAMALYRSRLDPS